MSQICLGKVSKILANDGEAYKAPLRDIAERYGYGIFPVDWFEPLVDSFHCFYFSLGETKWGDCEPILLPDGWYLGDFTNTIRFEERMRFLFDIAKYFIDLGFVFEYYIGWSLDQYNDYDHFIIKLKDLIPLLVETVGKDGQFASVHINIIPTYDCHL